MCDYKAKWMTCAGVWWKQRGDHSKGMVLYISDPLLAWIQTFIVDFWSTYYFMLSKIEWQYSLFSERTLIEIFYGNLVQAFGIKVANLKYL